MKRFFAVFLLLVLTITPIQAAQSELKEPQQFLVKYVIQYNSISLSEAAHLEKEIKKRYDDACDVQVIVEKIPGEGWITVDMSYVQ